LFEEVKFKEKYKGEKKIQKLVETEKLIASDQSRASIP